MKENIINMPIDESVKSASSEGGTKDQSAEKKRDRRKSLIKLAMLGILLVIAIIIGSLHMLMKQMTAETA